MANDWPLRQLDVNNVFLRGRLIEEVYLAQPTGFVDRDKPDYMCRLNKALYGLKQTPHTWYIELHNFLVQSGFVNSLADSSLFILKKHDNHLFVLV